ncbi:MAG: ATP-binding protein [Opitutales bacterium]
MLIDFQVENFLSFRDVCEFSALATPERQHGDRLSAGPLPRMRILPTTAVFGGNGSGKSNLVKALQVCRDMVLRGAGPDDRVLVTPFRLDAKYLERPSRFTLRFLAGEKIFRYAFAATAKEVVEESLVQERTASETVIFKRSRAEGWDLSGLGKLPADEREFVGFKTRDTLPNQLFLQEMRGKGIAILEEAIAWFRDCLEVIEPHTFILPFEFFGRDDQLEEFATSMLRHADTGISRVRFERLETLPLTEVELKEVREALKDETHSHLRRSNDGRRLRFRMRDGEIVADRLVTYHTDTQGREVRFEIKEESHGTRRLIDLLPLFYGLIRPGSRKVFVCDELDGNLHPLIIQALIREFHERCGKETRAQLIFTSHDATLFDQYLLRRDQLWMCSKKSSGATYLESLSDYKDVRVDTDIQKGYLLGRYSGVPRVRELLTGGGEK